MNKILITGSSGFLGKELIKKFKFRKVYLISKKKIKTYPEHHNIICNLTNKKKLISEIKKINPKVIYHLAWHGIPSFDKKNFKVNLKITKNLVEAINLSSCKKIIVSGTCAEYGFGKKIFYENSKKNLISPLGKQKEMTRNYLSNNLNKKIALIWVRIFYVYGPQQRKGSLMQFLEGVKNKKKILKLKYPYVFNDFIYIKDVIDALSKMEKTNTDSIINICTGKPTSNIDFIKKFEKVAKCKINIDSTNKINSKKMLYGSNTKLKNLGWKQKYSIKKAFREITN